MLLRQQCPGGDQTLHKLWWSGCKHFTSGHGIAGTVSFVKAAIHCADDLQFSVGMEVSVRYTRREIAQKPILKAAVECRPHLHRMCTTLRYNCISIYADRFDMIGALVQQQSQNLLRLQKAIKNRSELLSKRSVQLRSQKRYAAKLTLNPRRVNPECTESRSINTRVTAKKRPLPSLPLSQR